MLRPEWSIENIYLRNATHGCNLKEEVNPSTYSEFTEYMYTGLTDITGGIGDYCLE